MRMACGEHLLPIRRDTDYSANVRIKHGVGMTCGKHVLPFRTLRITSAEACTDRTTIYGSDDLPVKLASMIHVRSDLSDVPAFLNTASCKIGHPQIQNPRGMVFVSLSNKVNFTDHVGNGI